MVLKKGGLKEKLKSISRPKHLRTCEAKTAPIDQDHAFSRTRKGRWAIAQLGSTSRKPKFK